MDNKTSFKESVIYYSVKGFSAFTCWLPLTAALAFGRLLGRLAFWLDGKRRRLVENNLKTAFSQVKTPRQIQDIARRCFLNFGQNIIELMRLPIMNANKFKTYVTIDGRENVELALKKGKGVILLAMHFGSWEIASLASAMLGHPYKVIVNPQKRFSRLDELLNSYRECGGSVVIARGLATREFIRALKNNEIVGMVMDQGGRDGQLVPFFDRQASMSVGAIRTALKWGTPVCFAVIVRQQGPYHRMIIHPPLELAITGDQDKDIYVNLCQVTSLMEQYIREYPQEYMWFYKIWKYSRQAVTLILHDGRTGHLRQSQTVAKLIGEVLQERGMTQTVSEAPVAFAGRWAGRKLSLWSLGASFFSWTINADKLRHFLTKDSFAAVTAVKPDIIISCGSSTAAVNYVLAHEQQAKSIVVLKPGTMDLRHFDLAVLPQHDISPERVDSDEVVVTKAAPNLINPEYLEEQARGLLKHFSHLKIRDRYCIGLLLGGDTKYAELQERKVRVVVNQLLEVANEVNAEILVTTSRRTSEKIDSLVLREMKKDPHCRLIIIANKQNVPEAVGGILGLSDVVVVSGDSISMISEAVSSGKKTIVFPLENHVDPKQKEMKHRRFIHLLHEQGYLLEVDARDIKQAVYRVMKNKIPLRKLDDHPIIKEKLKGVV